MTTYNKIIVNGQTKLDLSSDSVVANKVLSGYTFHDQDGVAQTGTCNYDAYTSDATATNANILATKTAYVNGSKVTGIMTNNGSVTGTISTKAQQYTVPQGYHDGGGKVSIAAAEQNKIINTNIKSGVTILGVLGTYTGEGGTYQAKTVTPSHATQSITADAGYDALSAVTVNPITVTETATPGTNGYTISI